MLKKRKDFKLDPFLSAIKTELEAFGFELDTDPPPKASYEVKNLLAPIPFQVNFMRRSAGNEKPG